MKLKQLIADHNVEFTQKYGHRLAPAHRLALDAISACRDSCGEFHAHCDNCHTTQRFPLSCGHRSCPQCQNHLGQQWLERQVKKLLPVDYFMATFTLPQEFRQLARDQPTLMYDLLFKASAETLKTIGRNNHGMELAMTGVLHTHQRNKDFHPHIHYTIPGGGVFKDKKGLHWKPFNDKFLVNEFALAQVFRGIFLRMVFDNSIPLPQGLPNKWVVNVVNVGRGDKALTYLHVIYTAASLRKTTY